MSARRKYHNGSMGQGIEPSGQHQELGFEPFKLAGLLERHERDPEAFEAAKRADLARVARDLAELSGVSQNHPDYLVVQRMVGDFEEVLDQMIERILAEDGGLMPDPSSR